MASGRPTKWIEATITQSIDLKKNGITLVLWDKWVRQRRGTAIISVGGISWKPYGNSKVKGKLSWDQIVKAIMK